MSSDTNWLLFSYKVPADPSTLRVRIWRTLKAIGALYIQQSVCLTPAGADIKKKLLQIQKLVSDSEGESLLLEVNQFSESSLEELIEKFNAQRTMEYGEFLEGCSLFSREIETETSRRNFTFHEVEENEADLLKLKRWHRKIVNRDFFGCSLQSRANESLTKCEEMLKSFTNQVYRLEGNLEGDIE